LLVGGLEVFREDLIEDFGVFFEDAVCVFVFSAGEESQGLHDELFEFVVDELEDELHLRSDRPPAGLVAVLAVRSALFVAEAEALFAGQLVRAEGLFEGAVEFGQVQLEELVVLERVEGGRLGFFGGGEGVFL